MSSDLEKYYLNTFKELKKAEVQAKKFVRQALPFENKTKNLIKEIEQARKKLSQIFSRWEVVRICKKCHLSNGCCKKTDSHLAWQDLVYLTAKNLQFQLPYPDINFLISRAKPSCLFLSAKGCLLKENRPVECLTYICQPNVGGMLKLGIEKLINNGILDRKEFSNLLENLTWKSRLLFFSLKSKICSGLVINQKDIHLSHITYKSLLK